MEGERKSQKVVVIVKGIRIRDIENSKERGGRRGFLVVFIIGGVDGYENSRVGFFLSVIQRFRYRKYFRYRLICNVEVFLFFF